MGVKPIATMSFFHGKHYRKGELVEEGDAVVADLEKKGLVTTKAAPEPSNKKAPEPENKSKTK
ncbi:hypothetical protein [Burkholderia gladioli]|uniref:hypothetical protein n=1 Tax=Burkholderia gladioli TaxID=28095 RepID=UPI00164061E6|nr:hypothetical protein [Burkholderia gladioli]